MTTSSRTFTYRRADGADLQMDVWTPSDGGGPRPAVLFVHGGGWRGGRRGQFAAHAQRLAGEGCVTASADYRLSGVAPWPAALDDCQCAVRWLRIHANELGLDPARIGAFGSSAGGHLAACLGVRDTRHDAEPGLAGVSSRVQCVVDVHGVHDFGALRFDGIIRSAVALLGGTPAERPEAWADASPLRFVNAEAAPTLLIHDPTDPTVPYEQSTAFASALMAAGRPVSFIPTPASGHGFIYNLESEWSRRVWPTVLAWLRQWLNPES